MKTSVLRTAGVVTAVAAVAAGALFAAGPAAADPVPTLNVAYDASGSSLVAKPNSTVALGPTTLTTYLAPDGSFTGDLPLPPTASDFNVIGFVPAHATVTFVPVGQVKGKLITKRSTSVVKGSATYYIKLSDVTLAGIPTFVGDKCQTAKPVKIPIATPEGGAFNIETGGTVVGTYTIGEFANCGLTTGIINSLVPGPGNTVTFTLSNGRILSQ